MTSLQERLKEAREERECRPVRLPIPGYRKGALVAVYKAPQWGEARGYVHAVNAGAPSSVELDAIADALVDSSTGMEARIDGETQTIPHKLGKGLTDYLGIDGAENDRQAVYLLIPDDLEMVAHWDRLVAESRSRRKRAEDELSGESQAS